MLAEKYDSINRRALFDAQTRVKVLSIACERLRPYELTAAQMTQNKQLHYKIREQGALIKWLREQAIDPRLLAHKDAAIARLQRATVTQILTDAQARDDLAREHLQALENFEMQIAQKDVQ